jgi:hypothetical protein
MDIQNALDTINTYQWNSEQLKGNAILSVYALKGIVGYAASQNKPVEDLSPTEIVEAIKLVDLTGVKTRYAQNLSRCKLFVTN